MCSVYWHGHASGRPGMLLCSMKAWRYFWLPDNHHRILHGLALFRPSTLTLYCPLLWLFGLWRCLQYVIIHPLHLFPAIQCVIHHPLHFFPAIQCVIHHPLHFFPAIQCVIHHPLHFLPAIQCVHECMPVCLVQTDDVRPVCSLPCLEVLRLDWNGVTGTVEYRTRTLVMFGNRLGEVSLRPVCGRQTPLF